MTEVLAEWSTPFSERFLFYRDRRFVPRLLHAIIGSARFEETANRADRGRSAFLDSL